MTSVTDSLDKLRGSYGGSEKTSPSFLRPQHVKYNTPAKARKLGTVDNLAQTITGSLGSQDGANTLYFKVVTNGKSDLRITKNVLNKHEDKYLAVGILNSNYDPLQLNEYGFTHFNEIENTVPLEAILQQPKGTYYFTVTNSQWQSIPFSINVQVIRYVLLDGSTEDKHGLSGRIALVKLYGVTSGTSESTLTFLPTSQLKVMNGTSLGIDQTTGALTIMKGTVTMSDQTYGRLRMTWRINGTASGSSSNTATLTVTSPGGGY
jgi:hypothetical protein